MLNQYNWSSVIILTFWCHVDGNGIGSSRLDTCAALRYWNGKQWCPIPDWAFFFIRLGWHIRCTETERERALIAVSVPHRGFAASFAGLGAIIAEPVPQPTPEDIGRHFANLQALPYPTHAPTGLTYLHNGRKLRGLFAGAVTSENTALVKVCVQAKSSYKSGGLTHFVKELDAVNLQIDPESQGVLGRNVKGTALASHGDFVKHFYSLDELHLIHLASRCGVMMIGRVNSIRAETTQLRCAIRAHNTKFDEGVLNDILRIRTFITDPAKARVAIQPTLREAGPQTEDRSAARLAVFDGADAFVKWGSFYNNCPVIVLLDRTEPQFDEGIGQVNGRYLSRSADYRWPAGIDFPPGIDVTGFLEARR